MFATALAVQAQPAPPAAGVQVYGTIDVGVGQLSNQNPGAPTVGVTKVRGLFSGNLQTSYIGFRGNEDLGGGLSARFVLDSFIRVDTGTTGRFDASGGSAADPFWSRNAYLALAGGFGEVRLGLSANPLWVAMLQTSAMGSNSVFSPSFRQLFNGSARGRSVVDTGVTNGIHYQSPSVSGVSVLAAVQAGEGRGTDYNHFANAVYRSGPWVLAAAVQNARHTPAPALATTANQEMWLVGGAYNFGVMRVFGQFTEVDNGSNKSRLPHFGLTVPVGAGLFQLSSAEDKNKVAASGAISKRRTTSLGYIHALSKRTELYGFAMTEKYPVVGPARNSGESWMLGTRHTF